nr:transposase [Kallotenue papyrolyticum]
MYDGKRLLPEWKRKRPSMQIVHSQVLQNVQTRVDLAFKAFFRRVKTGEKPGYPRFRGKGRYDSFTYPQFGFALEGNRLKLSKIGSIKIRLHRPIAGTVKTLTIRRTATGEWFACFAVEREMEPMPPSEKAVGIDVGLESFATLSDGTTVANHPVLPEG